MLSSVHQNFLIVLVPMLLPGLSRSCPHSCRDTDVAALLSSVSGICSLAGAVAGCAALAFTPASLFAGLLGQLLAAQQWVEAHQVFCCHLAPRLFLAAKGSLHSPRQRQLQKWLAKLQQQQPQAGSAVGRDAWDAGAGLYLSFMEVSLADHLSCSADCWLPDTWLPSICYTCLLLHVQTV